MHASQPVRPPPSRLDGHLGALGTVVAAALLIAIVKPWGPGAGADVAIASPTVAPSPSPRPSPTRSPGPQIGFSGLAYDESIFGNHEPAATWQLWPAGYLVTYGFVIQLHSAESPGPGASSGPTPLPFAGSPSGSLADLGPAWPARFDVPAGDHLFLIGINMPRGYSVGTMRLARYPTGSSFVTVQLEALGTPWPDHFAVIGVPTGSGDGRLDVWQPGLYRLDLTFLPGGINRSLEISITG